MLARLDDYDPWDMNPGDFDPPGVDEWMAERATPCEYCRMVKFQHTPSCPNNDDDPQPPEEEKA